MDKNINDFTKELLKLGFALSCAGDNSVWAGTWLFVLGNPLGYGSKSIKWNGRQRVTKEMFRWTLSHFLCSKATWFLWRFCSWGWWGRWQGGCRWTPGGSSWYSICTITFTEGGRHLLCSKIGEIKKPGFVFLIAFQSSSSLCFQCYLSVNRIYHTGGEYLGNLTWPQL